MRCEDKGLYLSHSSYVQDRPGSLPLATVICDVRLVPAMEVGSCVQWKSPDWWFCLELTDVHVVLHWHLQDSIASPLSLHLHCAPCLRNLQSTCNITYWKTRHRVVLLLLAEHWKAAKALLKTHFAWCYLSTISGAILFYIKNYKQ